MMFKKLLLLSANILIIFNVFLCSYAITLLQNQKTQNARTADECIIFIQIA